MTLRSILLLIPVALGLVGCASTPSGEGASVPKFSLDEKEFWSQALEADVLYLPEVHDNERHHAMQLAVLKGLHERGEPVILAMEMFNLDQQEGLDRWQAGRLSLDAFLESVNWQKSWGGYTKTYETIIRAAESRDIPVVAMNAPRSVVKAVSQGEPVAASDQRWLPEDFRTPRGGMAFFKTQMEGHPGMDDAAWDRYYAVQALWEQTMATTILRLHAENPDSIIVAMLGRGHSDPRFGVPHYVGQKSRMRQMIVDLDGRGGFQLVAQRPANAAIQPTAHE